MTDVERLSITDVKLVNDKYREKWSRKGADGSFYKRSMTNVNMVNDKCKHGK